MRRVLQLTMLCAVAGVGSACSPDKVITTENIPTAGVRFINALPDTGAAFGLDFRFVDLPESNAHFRITFRNTPTTSAGVTGSTQIQYKNARAGSRRFRMRWSIRSYALTFSLTTRLEPPGCMVTP